jgi:hypothetical protein
MSNNDDEDESTSTADDAEPEMIIRPKRKMKPKAKVVKPKAKAKSNGKAKVVAKPKKQAKKSRNVDLSKLDQFGFRLDSKKHKAAVMYASKRGATLAEVKKALKSTQFNLLTELEGRGFKIRREAIAGSTGRAITRFHIVA